MDFEEKILIEALKKGEEKAFRYLFDRHYVVLCKFANGFLHDSFWAESIVDDIFFHLWEIRDNLEIKTSIRSYLLQSVRNRCINYMQSAKVKHEISISIFPLETMDENIFFKENHSSLLGFLLEKELENKICEVIKKMPEDTFSVFKKSRYENKKNEEIASDLGISVNTVKYHMKHP